MDQAAEWVESLLEGAGGAAPALRAFVRAFPPAARWGEPWPTGAAEDEAPPAFAPAARSYAAALGEVAAGRRRVRIEGRWIDGEKGTVLAGARTTLADEHPAWSILSTSG
jgi:hypothetical protein